MSASAAVPRRSLWPLWAMVAIFAAPVLAAWFFYFYPQYLPEQRSNRGELIDPVVTLPEAPGLRTAAGEPLDRERLFGRWTLVYLAGGPCAEDCLARLRDLRQIRLALGEGSQRVDRLLILTSGADAAEMSRLTGRFDGLQVAEARGPFLDALLAQLGPEPLDRVYLLDPMGQLMMRYAQDAPAKDTLRDMERLLKASKSWIKGAQHGH